MSIDGVFLPGVRVCRRGPTSPPGSRSSTRPRPRGLFIDTTVLANGTHTIGWLVTDSLSNADGVGSRFFTVQNGSLTAAATASAESAGPRQMAETAEPIVAARGVAELPELIYPDSWGDRTVRLPLGERIEARLPHGFESAYQLVNGDRRPLPAGSTWDAASGVFYWQPATPHLGEFQLVFAGPGGQLRFLVIVDPAR